MFNPERINIRKKVQADKDKIYYWMQASQRVEDNFSLEYLIKTAQESQKEPVVIFCLVKGYPNANRRHYYFMLEGILKVKKRIESMGLKFIIEIGNPIEVIPSLDECSLLIMDKGYTFVQRKWRDEICSVINADVIEIEDNVIVPVEIASSKEEYGAYTLRPKLWRAAHDFYYDKYEPEGVLYYNLSEQENNEIEEMLEQIDVDKGVKEIREIEGGEAQAHELLNHFLEERIKNYEDRGNTPDYENGSELSPYLHFGQISPLKIYRQASEFKAENFIEQFFVRRELAVNFVWYNINYNGIGCIAAKWILDTMTEHKYDNKEYIYILESFESAATHDKYWNYAQKELVYTGKINSYMRMYWGKKIIEWSATYEEAYKTMIYLNDKYALDGRDPNGYAGIAWCFGKHDRPWNEREIFGKIRYMNSAGLVRKFNMEKYEERIKAIIGDE